MRILKKHFGGKATYIVGDYIKNGCQTFHISKAQKVFDSFEVPLKMRKETLEAYAENKKVEEDWEELALSDDYFVRVLVVYNKKCLDILVKDPNEEIRLIIAKQGFGLEELINDDDWRVRIAVAEQGFGLEKLVNDEEYFVKRSALEKLKELENK